LRYEEEFVNRIVVDVRTAENLLGGSGQSDFESGLRGEVVELDAEVDGSPREFSLSAKLNQGMAGSIRSCQRFVKVWSFPALLACFEARQI
jgi:hypothetical protein